MIKKKIKKIFLILIGIIVYNKQINANLKTQCILNKNIHKKIKIHKKVDNNIYIKSKKIIGKYPEYIKFQGNVSIKKNDQNILADEVQLIENKYDKNLQILRKIIAIGDVYYSNPYFIFRSPIIYINLNNKNTDIKKGKYVLKKQLGRGYADHIKLRNNYHLNIFKNAMFTTCLEKNNSWNITGSNLILDYDSGIAKIWNAYFNILNIPVLYSPYLQLPINNRRSSGFLLFQNNNYIKNNNINFPLPFYWNITPNYDYTITPEFMNFNIIKINNEFRYLNQLGRGNIIVDWFNNKKKLNYINNQNKNTWLFHWDHSVRYNNRWNLNIDYTKVNNENYFHNIQSEYNFINDGYAIQQFDIVYHKYNWNISLIYKNFQNLINFRDTRTYKIEPQINFNYYKYNLGAFNFKLYSQFNNIKSFNKFYPNSTRIHIEPILNLPLYHKGISIDNTIKIMTTYYNQKFSKNIFNNSLKQNTIRIIPSIKSDAKLVLIQNFIKKNNYLQTLEPRIQYLYVSYKNQNNIHNYDSFLTQNNYHGLFHNYIYNGLDRIPFINQLTAGITTRLYDDELNERFNFSIGQIYYFKQYQLEQLNIPIKNTYDSGTTLWASNIFLRLTDNWIIRGGLQYNKNFNNIIMSNITTEYSLNTKHMIQLSYRFINPIYMKSITNNHYSFNQGISQVGILLNISLNNNWKIFNSFYYDIKEKKTISEVFGLEYNNCCWSISLGYKYKISDWKPQINFNNYNDYWIFNIQLKGFNKNFENQPVIKYSILPY